MNEVGREGLSEFEWRLYKGEEGRDEERQRDKR